MRPPPRPGGPRVPSVRAELLHFLGEVEVVFGLWIVPLMIAIVMARGWETAVHYLNGGVNFTEPLFVVVIMAMASTRPVVELAERTLRRLANLGRSTPAAWWLSILIVAPLLGSFITEPGAMTIAALLLAGSSTICSRRAASNTPRSVCCSSTSRLAAR